MPQYKMNLGSATIDGNGELSGDTQWAVDFDLYAPSGSYTIDSPNEQLVLTASDAQGDGKGYNFKASLPEINPGGSIVVKLDGWVFGPNAGLGTNVGAATRLNDTMAVEGVGIVLQEYASANSLDNGPNQIFLHMGPLRNVIGGGDWNDLAFDTVTNHTNNPAGWTGMQDPAGDILGVFNGATSPWGLSWWNKRVVAAHWDHNDSGGGVNSRATLHTTLSNMGSPYSGGSIVNDSVDGAYNKLIQQFYGYYRLSAPDASTMEMHYSPNGTTWYLIHSETGFTITNRMGLHFFCRLSDSVVKFSNILASPNSIIQDATIFEPYNTAFDWTLGNQLTSIVNITSGVDAAGNPSNFLLKAESDKSTTFYSSSDLTDWGEFKERKKDVTAIDGIGKTAIFGDPGVVCLGTSTGKLYEVPIAAGSEPGAPVLLFENPDGKPISVVHHGKTAGEWIFADESGMIKSVAEGGGAIVDRLDLNAVVAPGAKVVDIATGPNMTAVISRKADFTFDLRLITPDWITSATAGEIAPVLSNINPVELNYNHNLGVWVAAGAGGTVVTTPDINAWLV